MSGYGSTESEARTNAYNQAISRGAAPSTIAISCQRPSYGPPWLCTAYYSASSTVSVTVGGTTQTEAYNNTYQAMLTAGAKPNTISIYCTANHSGPFHSGHGYGWRCTGTGTK